MFYGGSENRRLSLRFHLRNSLMAIPRDTATIPAQKQSRRCLRADSGAAAFGLPSGIYCAGAMLTRDATLCNTSSHATLHKRGSRRNARARFCAIKLPVYCSQIRTRGDSAFAQKFLHEFRGQLIIEFALADLFTVNESAGLLTNVCRKLTRNKLSATDRRNHSLV